MQRWGSVQLGRVLMQVDFGGFSGMEGGRENISLRMVDLDHRIDCMEGVGGLTFSSH